MGKLSPHILIYCLYMMIFQHTFNPYDAIKHKETKAEMFMQEGIPWCDFKLRKHELKKNKKQKT